MRPDIYHDGEVLQTRLSIKVWSYSLKTIHATEESNRL